MLTNTEGLVFWFAVYYQLSLELVSSQTVHFTLNNGAVHFSLVSGGMMVVLKQIIGSSHFVGHLTYA